MAENTDAKIALFAEIERQTKALADAGWGSKDEAAIVKDLAAAYRFTVGGQQPGSSVVTN